MSPDKRGTDKECRSKEERGGYMRVIQRRVGPADSIRDGTGTGRGGRYPMLLEDDVCFELLCEAECWLALFCQLLFRFQSASTCIDVRR